MFFSKPTSVLTEFFPKVHCFRFWPALSWIQLRPAFKLYTHTILNLAPNAYQFNIRCQVSYMIFLKLARLLIWALYIKSIEKLQNYMTLQILFGIHLNCTSLWPKWSIVLERTSPKCFFILNLWSEFWYMWIFKIKL